jgi:hypothetical protein
MELVGSARPVEHSPALPARRLPPRVLWMADWDAIVVRGAVAFVVISGIVLLLER